MRTIMVVNSKGGSGKSTLATNLASFYACWGIRVSLVDFDPQTSGLDWLRARPTDRPRIHGVPGDLSAPRLPPESDYAIMDLPSGMGGKELAKLLQKADSVIIPVLPSPMDIRATGKFVFELLQDDVISARQIPIAVVANRVRQHTRIYQTLKNFLNQLGIPFVGTLRDTQNYVAAAERGLGIFELPTRSVLRDLVQWQPLLNWLTEEKLSVVPPVAPVDTI